MAPRKRHSTRRDPGHSARTGASQAARRREAHAKKDEVTVNRNSTTWTRSNLPGLLTLEPAHIVQSPGHRLSPHVDAMMSRLVKLVDIATSWAPADMSDL